MYSVGKIRRFRRIVIYTAFAFLFLFLFMLVFVDRFVEPILKKRINTLIVKGSDSLYTYKMEDLEANFFGGSVEVKNLQIDVDSNRYDVLRKKNALPSLTMQLRLEKGLINGIGLFKLLFNHEIRIEEIRTEGADLKLSRHLHDGETYTGETDQPLWRSIRPQIEDIRIKRIRLDGLKLLYRNADTAESMKLQFDECNALFEDVRIDSISASDSLRIGFSRNISMQVHDLKFRTVDSTYKMKAEWIHYSSEKRSLEIDSFKLQPTLDIPDFYKKSGQQQSLYFVEFHKIKLVNTRLDRFIHNNSIEADSVIFQIPNVKVYNDRSVAPSFDSKIGNYPHQKLLAADETINIKYLKASDGHIEYREKNEKTMQEGVLAFSDIIFSANNVTNEPEAISLNPICTATASGHILGASPFDAGFQFRLDSSNGSYEARGSIRNITTAQLSPLALSLAGTQLNSFLIPELSFQVRGEDYEATGDVKMKYNNFSMTLLKKDEETGVMSPRKFLTRVLNNHVFWPSNPAAGGIERVSLNKRVLRLTSHSFFGLLWKTIFAGMRSVMTRS